MKTYKSNDVEALIYAAEHLPMEMATRHTMQGQAVISALCKLRQTQDQAPGTPTQQVEDTEAQARATFDYPGRLMHEQARRLAAEVETMDHFKRAYSRALNYVCELHLAAAPTASTDDPFFASPETGNCCAVDILIAEVRRLRAPSIRSRLWQAVKDFESRTGEAPNHIHIPRVDELEICTAGVQELGSTKLPEDIFMKGPRAALPSILGLTPIWDAAELKCS